MYDGMCEVIDAALVESGKIGEISMGAVFAWDGVFLKICTTPLTIVHSEMNY